MGVKLVAAIVGVVCVALGLGWKALLSVSPIDPLPFDLPPPPDRVGILSYNNRLHSAFKLAFGQVLGPEDLAVDSQGRLYTACADGWIKRISFESNDSYSSLQVEKWAYVGGRPLGIVLGLHGELLVCEASRGLLNVTEDKVELLSGEAEGLPYRLADGVDVDKDGIIYFTDASYKYGINFTTIDIIEGRPRGRLLKYDPATNTTSVLLKDLYFANGVALSPKQDFLVFCETSMFRCKKFWLDGPKKGQTELFIDRLPGFPDNIRYDGQGIFWIGLPTSWSPLGRTMVRYPSLRHLALAMAAVAPRVIDAAKEKESSVLGVNENGEAVALFSYPGLTTITVGLRVGEFLYYGGLHLEYIGRLHFGTEL
ncbi:protein STRICTOSIDINE SYNTHASE-LIKE 5 [Cryptomeria japonica]|uniref:protein STRICTOSIDINE SYNTHASE-LIKE 5 n=1 Tax=Cryptomeria japonica TaxID=3369 RepID=UPI0027DA46D0|nr:protein STRICTOSIDINE SYNTHASE-LIKE 5 [Cryptomeria japonica]